MSSMLSSLRSLFVAAPSNQTPPEETHLTNLKNSLEALQPISPDLKIENLEGSQINVLSNVLSKLQNIRTDLTPTQLQVHINHLNEIKQYADSIKDEPNLYEQYQNAKETAANNPSDKNVFLKEVFHYKLDQSRLNSPDSEIKNYAQMKQSRDNLRLLIQIFRPEIKNINDLLKLNLEDVPYTLRGEVETYREAKNEHQKSVLSWIQSEDRSSQVLLKDTQEKVKFEYGDQFLNEGRSEALSARMRVINKYVKLQTAEIGTLFSTYEKFLEKIDPKLVGKPRYAETDLAIVKLVKMCFYSFFSLGNSKIDNKLHAKYEQLKSIRDNGFRAEADFTVYGQAVETLNKKTSTPYQGQIRQTIENHDRNRTSVLADEPLSRFIRIPSSEATPGPFDLFGGLEMQV